MQPCGGAAGHPGGAVATRSFDAPRGRPYRSYPNDRLEAGRREGVTTSERTAVEGVACARAAGVEVIVTDHHLVPEQLPAGAVVVNPKQPGCAYPEKNLAACGIALKIALAVARRAGVSLSQESLLRAACLGTIADLVPLTGGYRRIPVLQIGADVYCDSQLIAPVTIGEAPDVPGARESHSSEARGLGLGDGHLRGALHHQVAHGVVSVDERHRGAFLHHANLGMQVHAAGTDPPQLSEKRL